VSHIDGLKQGTKVELDEMVAAVEIVNARGELERVYFRYPSFCRRLSRETRDRILWSVDRETPGKQLIDFMATFAPEAYAETKHLQALVSQRPWQMLLWIHEHARVVEVMFGLAVAQNVLLLARYSSLDFDAAISEYLFGLIQLLCSGTVFARAAMHNSFRGWRELLHNKQLIFLTFAALFACLGLLVSPLFFCFHLLDIVVCGRVLVRRPLDTLAQGFVVRVSREQNKYAALQDVFRAVTLNGTALMLTAVFGVIIIWIYAVVGFAFLSDLFTTWDDVGDRPVDVCTDLFVCWVSALSSGLRMGDLGGVMQTIPHVDGRWSGSTAYTFSYWMVVTTVLLNLIFGIIIDTVRRHNIRSCPTPTCDAHTSVALMGASRSWDQHAPVYPCSHLASLLAAAARSSASFAARPPPTRTRWRIPASSVASTASPST
jgi:hypothetical protein